MTDTAAGRITGRSQALREQSPAGKRSASLTNTSPHIDAGVVCLRPLAVTTDAALGVVPGPAAHSELLEHDAVRHPVGQAAADTRASEPVLGAARSFSDPSVGGAETVVVVGAIGIVVAGDVAPGAVVPVARVVVVVAPTAVVLGVLGMLVVVVVVVDVLRAAKVKASASVSV